jgi:hypothetical protein
MKFTAIIGVAATLLGVAFASSAEAEKVVELGAEIAALRGKVSRKMERAGRGDGKCKPFFANQTEANKLYQVVCDGEKTITNGTDFDYVEWYEPLPHYKVLYLKKKGVETGYDGVSLLEYGWSKDKGGYQLWDGLYLGWSKKKDTTKCKCYAATDSPTASPTDSPTASPTDSPTANPTDSPTASPTDSPTASPTKAATANPTDSPTASPTDSPTASPTKARGCMNETAMNYNSYATEDDGSCQYAEDEEENQEHRRLADEALEELNTRLNNEILRLNNTNNTAEEALKEAELEEALNNEILRLNNTLDALEAP